MKKTYKAKKENRKYVKGKAEEFIKPEKEWDKFLDKEGYFTARVVEVQKKYSFLAVEPSLGEIHTKDIFLGTLARKYMQAEREERNFVVVGDRVLCLKTRKEASASEEIPQCSIEFRAPRASKISRLDPMRKDREHVLASNMSQLVILASFAYPKLKWGLIDRFLVLSEEEGLDVCIILNKTDLLKQSSEEFQKECSEMIQLYRSLNYKIILTQADSGKLPKEVEDAFKDKISLVTGHSGVGKSSIINLMSPEIVQDVETEEVLYKGRHTTTYASFIKLGTGGFVIDSPGIRSLSIKDYNPLELSSYFVDLKKYISHCKFRECKHIEEPGCAVLAALDKGEISPWRYKSYVAILTGASSREGRISIEWEE